MHVFCWRPQFGSVGSLFPVGVPFTLQCMAPPLSVISRDTLGLSLRTLILQIAFRSELKISAKSLGLHKLLLATYHNLGVAHCILPHFPQSLFSLPFNPISSWDTFHVLYHMAHSRQLARDGVRMSNFLFLLTHLRVPFSSFQPYRVSLRYS